MIRITFLSLGFLSMTGSFTFVAAEMDCKDASDPLVCEMQREGQGPVKGGTQDLTPSNKPPEKALTE